MSKCLNCGEELVQLPGKRKKKYCNSTCRSNKWQAKDRKNKKKELAGKKTEPAKVKFKKKPEPIPAGFNSAVSLTGVPIQVDYVKPKTLKQLKEMAPKNLTGLDRSSWISQARKKYNV